MSKNDAIWIILLIIIGLITTLPFWNAKGDDAFITFRFVKNFVDHGQLAYNLGEPSYGFTSPLWIGILSALYFIFRDMYIAAWIACFLSLIAMVVALWVLVSKVVENRTLRIISILFLLIDPWFIRWAFSGQEIVFKIFIATSLILIGSRCLENEKMQLWRYCLAGLVFVVGVLTRPEFMALLVITIFVALTIRKYKAALFILITFVIFYGAWALFCKNQFGSFYPHTILVKTSLSKNIGIADSIKQMIKWALPRYFLIIILPVIPLITISFIMVVPKKNLLRTIKAPITILIMILWVVCVTLAYFLSGTYMASMYTLIFSPFIPIFCITILYKTKESISEKRMSNYVFATLLFALIIGFGVISLRLGSYSWLVSDKYDRGDDSRYIEYAEWINKNLPDSARIATEELGIVGWFGQRYMIDLAGIATPSLLKPGADDTLVALKPTHFTFYGKPIDKYKNFELKPIKSVQFRRIGGRYSLDYLDTCTLYEVAAISGR